MQIQTKCEATKKQIKIDARWITAVSEKKGAFICELILERYKFLRNTQKQLKITKYGRNKSFLEFHLVYIGVCLKIPWSLF